MARSYSFHLFRVSAAASSFPDLHQEGVSTQDWKYSKLGFKSVDPYRHPNLDHGYAMTSHSSQGQTADRVLIEVDTELGVRDLLNSRMAYVAVSCGAHNAQIFTNNASALGRELSRDVSHVPAI